jgi:putative membrane protein
LIWVIIAMLLGILAGISTGLIPGLHTNTVAILVASASAILLNYFTPLEVGVFLVSMVVVHSFVDFIPSIFLGAPEDTTALGVLPGHELLMQGKGHRAVKLTVIGGIGTFFTSLLLIIPMFWFLEKIYPTLISLIVPILITISLLFILKEKTFKKIFWSSLIFLLSGILGLLTLNYLPVKQPLFPLLSGMFGISTLIISLLTISKIPKQQTKDDLPLFSISRLKEYITASFSSLFVSVLPAIGAAQAAVIAQAFTKFRDKEDFLVTLGGINTAAALFTLTTLLLLGKARTGVIAALNEIVTLNFHAYILLIVVCFFAMVIGAIITLSISKFAAKKVSKINYKKISLSVICFITILVSVFSNWVGLLILIVGTSIGMLAPLVKVRRIHLMACLVIPVIIYYI